MKNSVDRPETSFMSPIRASLDGFVDSSISDAPEVATWWLVDGLDSEEIRVLAGADPHDFRLPELLDAALESLGYGPTWRSELAEYASSPQVVSALSSIQHDLNAAGLSEYRVELSPAWLDVGEVPTFVVAVNGGWSTEVTTVPVTSDDDQYLLKCVAQSTQDDLKMSGRNIRWPLCNKHERSLQPVIDNKGLAVWRCLSSNEHVVASIGALPVETVA